MLSCGLILHLITRRKSFYGIGPKLKIEIRKINIKKMMTPLKGLYHRRVFAVCSN